MAMCLAAGCAPLRPAPPPVCPAPVAATAPAPPAPARAPLEAVEFTDVPGWSEQDPRPGLAAFLKGCPVLAARPGWPEACSAAAEAAGLDPAAARGAVEKAFRPHRVLPPEIRPEGLLTGYYEPLLQGSRSPSDVFRVPLRAAPDDLITVDLGAVAPETRQMRLRGRLQGRRLVPYWSRAEIETGMAPVPGRELVWVDDPLEAFFLQIQGSGRVRMPDGDVARLGYADQNGHPYRSIGRVLVERGALRLEQATMQGIKAWARDHPEEVAALLNENPSYVFFREMPAGPEGPVGSLGVPLTDGYSVAVDPAVVPLGAPVFIASTLPGGGDPLHRLAAAQDTGGAIRGGARADLFWGFGPEAGEQAGRTRQPLRMWVLLPRPSP